VDVPIRKPSFFPGQPESAVEWADTAFFIMMPSIKRQASDSFSQPQALVKRQKSNPDLSDSRALTVGAKDQNGALVSSVRILVSAGETH
jgi:hypothetical protein